MAKRAETALQFYLGIDPGRDKTGVALVEETGRILAVQVMRTRNFSDAQAAGEQYLGSAENTQGCRAGKRYRQ